MRLSFQAGPFRPLSSHFINGPTAVSGTPISWLPPSGQSPDGNGGESSGAGKPVRFGSGSLAALLFFFGSGGIPFARIKQIIEPELPLVRLLPHHDILRQCPGCDVAHCERARA